MGLFRQTFAIALGRRASALSRSTPLCGIATVVALSLGLVACGSVRVEGAGGSAQGGGGGAGGALCAPPTDHPLEVVWSQVVHSDPVQGTPGPGANPGDRSIDFVAADASGNTYVAGSYWNTGATFATKVLPDGGQLNAFLAKLGPDGTLSWLKTFASAGYNDTHSMVVTSDGGVAISIFVQAPIDFGAGSHDLSGNYVVRYAANGDYVFAQPGLARLAATSDGGIVMAGGIEGTIDLGAGPISGGQEAHPDALLAKLDASGAVVFARVFGDSTPNPLPSMQDQSFSQLAVSADNRIYVAGRISGNTTIDGIALAAPSLVVAGFDATGHASFAKAYGDDVNFATASSMITMADGNLLLSGGLSGSVDFGGGAVVSALGYLVALSPTGTVAWAKPLENAAVSAMAPSKCYVRIAGLAATGATIGSGALAGVADPNGFENGFEAVLSPAGDVVGSQRFVGTPMSLSERPDASFLLSGHFSPQLSFATLNATGQASPMSGFLVDAR